MINQISQHEPKSSQHTALSTLINFQEGDFLPQMLQKIQQLSTFIKKIQIDEDREFYLSQNKKYSQLITKAKRVIELTIKKLLTFSSKDPLKIDADFTMKNFAFISDSVDDMLEKVADNIDIIKGIKKENKEAELEEELKGIKLREIMNVTSHSISKSVIQLGDDEFDIDNSYYPFIPKIKIKYHEIVPLNTGIEDARRLRLENKEKIKTITFKERKVDNGVALFEHPYKEEIIQTLIKFSGKSEEFARFIRNTQLLSEKDRIKFHIVKFSHQENPFNTYFFSSMPRTSFDLSSLLTFYSYEPSPFNSTPFSYVDTEESLVSMINELEENSEIAVDLEHHSTESYLGITCLLQISTRVKDYVVDTLKLRGAIQNINRVFCNPSILKVFHGSDFDIEWLQKDFGVYVVNMFDTGQASRILQLPSFSLAYLLSSICSITADKKYQLADWRMRPLPAEMLKYAREDTHYLLYIHDELKKKLAQKAIMKNESYDIFIYIVLAFKKSAEICLKQYIKPNLKSPEYFQLIARNAGKGKRQISMIKLLYKFRDYAARKMDLSPQYMLSNKFLFQIARLAKYDIEVLNQNIDKYSNFRKFLPELLKCIEEKLIKNEQKIDNNNFKLLEQNYLDNIRDKITDAKKVLQDKKLLLIQEKKDDSQNHNENLKCEKSEAINASYDDTLFQLNELKLRIQVNGIKEKQSSKIVECENNSHRVMDIEDKYSSTARSFENFNLINYLKGKYNLKIYYDVPAINPPSGKEKKSAVKFQIPEEKIIPQKTFLQQKRKLPAQTQISDSSAGNNIDLTDNTNLFKKMRDNKIDLRSDSESSEESIDILEFQNNRRGDLSQDVKNMLAKEQFIKGKC